MGYHRPTAAFNPGKRSEHKERMYFIETVPHHHGDAIFTMGGQREKVQ